MIADIISGADRECTPSERRSVRRYQIEVAISIALYVVLLLISVRTVDHIAAGPLKTIVALLPMIGFSALLLAIVRLALRMDELQRQTMLVSGAIAALACAFITMALGFLQNAGLPAVGMMVVWPIIAFSFGVSLPFVRRRFR